jgi:Spy/CpxP family protein refolding chaperone
MIALTGLMLISNVPPTIAQGTSQRTAAQPYITSQSPAFKGIDLTKDQEQQIASLSKSTISKINAQLNAGQQQQIKTALDEGKDLRTAVQSVNLSFRQKRSMQGILQNMQSEMKEILTPAQYQQWEQNNRNRKNG